MYKFSLHLVHDRTEFESDFVSCDDCEGDLYMFLDRITPHSKAHEKSEWHSWPLFSMMAHINIVNQCTSFDGVHTLLCRTEFKSDLIFSGDSEGGLHMFTFVQSDAIHDDASDVGSVLSRVKVHENERVTHLVVHRRDVYTCVPFASRRTFCSFVNDVPSHSCKSHRFHRHTWRDQDLDYYSSFFFYFVFNAGKYTCEMSLS